MIKEKLWLLLKPQFEAGREKVGKKGVVREASTHKEVIKKIVDFALSHKLTILKGLDFSPIKGPEGNIEYLIYLKKDNNTEEFDYNIIDEVVDKSHSDL